MSSLILDIRARRARYADMPAQRIAPLRRTSDAGNADIPRTPILWQQGTFLKRAGLAQFARVVSLVTRQQREPSFSSLSDSELRESLVFRRGRMSTASSTMAQAFSSVRRRLSNNRANAVCTTFAHPHSLLRRIRLIQSTLALKINGRLGLTRTQGKRIYKK